MRISQLVWVAPNDGKGESIILHEARMRKPCASVIQQIWGTGWVLTETATQIFILFQQLWRSHPCGSSSAGVRKCLCGGQWAQLLTLTGLPIRFLKLTNHVTFLGSQFPLCTMKLLNYDCNPSGPSSALTSSITFYKSVDPVFWPQAKW